MILLTFAHRGEASRFLKKKHARTVDFPLSGLYQIDDGFLLVTGEGLQNATERVAAVCGGLGEEIESVINLGIAGALDDSLSLGEIYPVRVCYAEQNGSMQFRSFPTASFEDARARDCVSVNYRAVEPDEANRLINFASCVDREAWAIASVCALFNLPFFSYKLISDRVGKGQADLFEAAKEQGQYYSDRLFEFFGLRQAAPPRQKEAHAIALGERFYFTTSQKRRYRALMEGLRIKLGSEQEIWKRIDLEEIASAKCSAKARTGELLNRLGDLLNPLNAVIRKRLADLTKPLTDAGCSAHFAEGFQDDSITLSARVDNAESLRRLVEALNAVSLNEIHALLNGKLDV
ncbi:MAG: hypothetical protein JXA30_10455 [Deltaproteobacteria bacterium]|nr:hypothetical protein [Deltaproteobacteria bacterium]